MKTVSFCFATHNHQPIGNFETVFEEAYERAYRPFVELAAKFNIRFSTHFSGILLEWLATAHPEHIARMRAMHAAGTLELIGGGFYEPILSVISDRDKHAQLTKLTEYIRSEIGANVDGLWLAERVWEQQLCGPIKRAGMNYVILDDSHFRAAGLPDDELNGYYLTEDQGYMIAAFPISKALRYTIPFRPVDETIAVLREQASETGGTIVTFADDGEKFGVWPKTYDHVYTDGWLEEFFAKLHENRSWIVMQHFSEALKHHRPKGRIYLPNVSYAEMMQWALPSAEANRDYESFVHDLEQDPDEWKRYGHFVRGGFWRNFFVKYPESNHLHKRAALLSERFAVLDLSRSDVRAAYSDLLAAQCNDPYWHGVFGGIYLPNLRHEVYRHLLAAERYLDAREASKIRATVVDLDRDGVEDVVLSNTVFTVVVDPSRGGCIGELAFKPRAFELSNFINRRPEAYHDKLKHAITAEQAKATASIHDIVLTKEEGLHERLVYDWYRHGSMIEHFLSDDATVGDLVTQQFLEYGDFFRAQMAPQVTHDGKRASVTFDHMGSVHAHGEPHSVRLRKSLELVHDSSEIVVEYLLENHSGSQLDLRFASEWTFGLLAGDAHDRYFVFPDRILAEGERKLSSVGEVADVSAVSLVDEWGGYRIDLASATPVTVWRAPIETIASSEAGFERVYQGSIVFLVQRIALSPGDSRSLQLRIRVSEL
ncbi:MAG: DUF1926 domain-containing protein [Bacteroidetes bacterium]|nr:DUF1926 domain-containing protein [Bacteroidota bacterium]